MSKETYYKAKRPTNTSAPEAVGRSWATAHSSTGLRRVNMSCAEARHRCGRFCSASSTTLRRCLDARLFDAAHMSRPHARNLYVYMTTICICTHTQIVNRPRGTGSVTGSVGEGSGLRTHWVAHEHAQHCEHLVGRTYCWSPRQQT